MRNDNHNVLLFSKVYESYPTTNVLIINDIPKSKKEISYTQKSFQNNSKNLPADLDSLFVPGDIVKIIEGQLSGLPCRLVKKLNNGLWELKPKAEAAASRLEG
jgi:hypothetical protein